MENNTNLTINSEELKAAFEGGEVKKPKTNQTPKESPEEKQGMTKKKLTVFLILGLVGLIGGGIMLTIALLGMKKDEPTANYPNLDDEEAEVYYSNLTGEELSDKALATAPAYCIQTPNGTDGARPQAGLTDAGVIFEAIAEAGITRFAAIYQNPTTAIIGPIRSLRIYYLEWDTPFDCTIVHAGGSGDALAAVSSGGYKDLTENYTYMYRGTFGGRRWNNLFTTSALLRQYSSDSGNASSNIKGFTRMTPKESEQARVDGTVNEKLVITKPAKGDTSTMTPVTTAIRLKFGGVPSYNSSYTYDAESNKYLRGYESGAAHEVYGCPAEDLGERNPEDVCSLTQLSPSVVVAMMVQEHKASDNYHEDIKALGSGKAFVFQNGMAISGTWEKASKSDQIKFTDEAGSEIKLAPGQTIVSAVPDYGSVDF
ncbi:DUF3048 domain-containing protein [Candidatus Saccharibacteria bacterium]|nr:DUF3048 domain-containing protein [Candidatus Saccharibacteria bacterium]